MQYIRPASYLNLEQANFHFSSYIVSVAADTGLGMTCSETPKTGFSQGKAHIDPSKNFSLKSAWFN